MPKKMPPTFYYIGNHPVVDFINTNISSSGKPVDLLETFSSLLDWLWKADYISKEEVELYEQRWGNSGEGARALEAAKELRSSLQAIIDTSNTGEEIADIYLEPINHLLKERVITTKIVKKDSGFDQERHIKIQTSDDILIPLAEAAIGFISQYDLALVKQCEGSDCVLYFYDNSKNNTRRWCSQKTCGNRMKVAAYLERQQAKNKL